jgi:hypothetical protein
MPKPLREEINDVVERYLEHKLRTGEPVDVPGMAHEMAQSVVDMDHGARGTTARIPRRFNDRELGRRISPAARTHSDRASR